MKQIFLLNEKTYEKVENLNGSQRTLEENFNGVNHINYKWNNKVVASILSS